MLDLNRLSPLTPNFGTYTERNKNVEVNAVMDYPKGDKVFLIDAGVFPGSSGSPVFIFNQGSYPTTDGITIGNRLLFVGIITQTMLTNDKYGRDYLNLGMIYGL